jgi:hypothetical protein
MTDGLSLDGRTLVGVANTGTGEVSGETRFEFEQEGERIYQRRLSTDSPRSLGALGVSPESLERAGRGYRVEFCVVRSAVDC